MTSRKWSPRQLRACWQRSKRWSQDEVRDAIEEEECDGHACPERYHGVNDPPAQFIEVLEKPHHPAGFGVGLAGGAS